MTNYLLSCWFICSKVSVLFSIRFDEYDDPNEAPVYTFNSHDLPCSHIGSKCLVTEECCGHATCVLPAWSPSPVCLVPGYKEDNKLERMSAHNPPRREDVLYIRNMYNTTFFDFLLTDTISSTQYYGDTDGDFPIETSTEFIISTDISHNSFDLLNSSILESNNISLFSVENSSNDNLRISSELKEDLQKNMVTTLKPVFLNLSDITSETNLKVSSDLAQSLEDHYVGLSMLKRNKFLLINSTIRNIEYKANVSAIYENLKNSDQFKVVVKLLQEKLERLNEKENRTKFQNIALTDELDVPGTTEVPVTTSKSSRWDIVKRFFLHKQKTEDIANGSSSGERYLVAPNDISSKENSMLNKQITLNSFHEKNQAELKKTLSSNGIREIIKNLYPNNNINEIQKNNQMADITYTKKLKKVNDGDLVEYYNIKIPIDLSRVKKTKIENGKDTLAKAIRSSLLKNVQIQDNLNGGILKHLTSSSSKRFYEKMSDNTLESTTSKALAPINESHFWQLMYLWPIDKNSSVNFSQKFKHLFDWNRKTNISDNHETKHTLLNEHFLLHLNSLNVAHEHSKNGVESEKSVKNFPDSTFTSSSSDESASLNSEDLYNNSYVFVVSRRNKNDSKIQTKLDSILNFFHLTKFISYHTDKNSSVDPSETAQNFSKNVVNGIMEENPPSITEIPMDITESPLVQEIIRLPENLMPEALIGRQLNDTDILLLDDSKELEDKTIEEHSISNRTFLFFFKVRQ